MLSYDGVMRRIMALAQLLLRLRGAPFVVSDIASCSLWISLQQLMISMQHTALPDYDDEQLADLGKWSGSISLHTDRVTPSRSASLVLFVLFSCV